MTAMRGRGEDVAVSRFLEFTRAEWARLRAATPLPLTEPQLRDLVSLNERTLLDEVADVYLPLSRLLNLYVAAKRNLNRATATFLGSEGPRIPFVIGVAGSVAVGNGSLSTLALPFGSTAAIVKLRCSARARPDVATTVIALSRITAKSAFMTLSDIGFLPCSSSAHTSST